VIPLRDENPALAVPIVTRTLIALNVAAFAYELMLGPGLREFVAQWGLVPARLTLAMRFGEEPLLAPLSTAVTSMFLHGGFAHLLGNLWYLWIFGDNVEDRLGQLRYFVFYLVAGLTAATFHYFTNPASTVPTVGASGAIAGVLGAYLAAFPRARVVTLVPLFPFLQILAMPATLVLGLWFVFQFLSGALSLAAGGAGGGVAWWAHIGGFAFGFAAMKLFEFARPPARSWAGVE
jgi:membrane associated rhomboid family serine protease